MNIDEPAPTIQASAGARTSSGFGHGTCMFDLEGTTSKGRPRRDDLTKPPYRVPSMEEIRALPWNGFTVASTFSGAGGSSTGYRMAGFKVVWANEFIDAARDTYRANCADYTIVDGRDIRKVTPEDILATLGMKPGELDLFDGSPPCASFSTAGKREKGWGEVKKYSDKSQRTDDLFFEYIRLLRGLKPKTFVAENVSGLIKGTAKGYFLEILKELKASGYRVTCRVLDAQWLGVPQARQRTIFVGVRDDLGIDPAHPKPLPYRYSVRDALPWLTATGGIRSTGFAGQALTSSDEPSATIMAGGGGGMNTSQFGCEAYLDTFHGRREITEPSPTILTHGRDKTNNQILIAVGGAGQFGEEKWNDPTEPARTIGASPTTGNGKVSGGDILVKRIEPEADISRYAIGAEYDRLGLGGQSEKYFQLVRQDAGKPSGTITQRGGDRGVASVCHPTERRKFSIQELKRICAFPDDFVLTGTYAQKWERCGRAVPPVMMSHIAATIRDEILSKV